MKEVYVDSYSILANFKCLVDMQVLNCSVDQKLSQSIYNVYDLLTQADL